MTETNQKILDLILDEHKTLEVLSKEVNLSQRQIYTRLASLKNNGYNFNRKFYYNGSQSFKVERQIVLPPAKEGLTINIDDDDKVFNAVVISDLHLGSVFENIDALHKVYNYCSKEGINIILNGGDLIDGTFGNIKKTYNVHEQIKTAIKNHPYDKNILNFICLGNHDASAKTDYGIDFKEYLLNRRPDLIPVDYGNAIFNLKNDQIIVEHPVGYGIKNINVQTGLVLKGHSHITRVVDNANSIFMQLSSLSGIAMRPDLAFPCALKMQLIFTNGYITTGIFNQLLIQSNNVLVLNELLYDLGRGKKRPVNSEYDESKDKVLTKKSQIDKFNNKYGK